ncbi:MAG: sugar-transfer associated ATP-grasp domain-containing protein [Crocinitomicaceae bacterium]|nr:sugar-transfer associated ATP-grasp domain-containing protein [Crocinitomicaceae bacterium]
MKRIIYLGYYIKNLDKKKFLSFLNYTSKNENKNKFIILVDVFRCIFQYNISILEYFQFGFISKNKLERSEWAGTGYMFEYQLIMNPKNERAILDDKRKFFKEYKEYINHIVADVDTLKENPELVNKLLSNPSGKIVFKSSDGKCGIGVKVESTENFDEKSLLSIMNTNQYDLVEEFIIQHPELNKLSPSGVNTVRIFTQLDDNNQVVILGCRQRISVNSPIDNMAAGNLAAFIDEYSGIVTGPGVYSDITKMDENIHPITGVSIIGFQVPYWEEAIEMVKGAAIKHPQNRSIGWDIVITENGPGFIEGNHDWCKLLWQLPAKKGLKYMLKDEYRSFSR